MKNIFFIVLFYMFSFTQSQTIRGTVKDDKGNTLQYVNISVKGTKIGTETNEEGFFKLSVTENSTLVFSYIGFKTKEVKVETSKSNLTVTLYEGNELLKEVVLNTSKNKFARKKTAYVSKLPLKDIENSNVYSTITNELLESQIVTSLDDALVNATGVSKLWEATGRSAGFGTGFFSSRGFAVQPTFVDGVPGYTFSAIDPSYIERVEVIKGPSATLFGSTETSLGGLINIVTKKPYKGQGGSIGYTGGSFNLHRISADFNTHLDKKKSAYMRINSSYTNKESFQDAGFNKTIFVAPSFTYQPINDLTFSLGFEFSDTEQTNPAMFFLRRGHQIVATNPKELNLDYYKSFTNNDITLRNKNYNLRLITDYQISDRWKSQTVFSGNYANTNGYYQQLVEGAGAAFKALQPLTANAFLASNVQPILDETAGNLDKNLFTRIFSKVDENAQRFNIQQNFSADLKFGDIKSKLLFGIDYVNRKQNFKNQNGNPNILKHPKVSELLLDLNFLLTSVVAPGSPQEKQIRFALSSISNFGNTLPYFDAFLTPKGKVFENSFAENAQYNTSKNGLDEFYAQIPISETKLKSETLAFYLSKIIHLSPNLTISSGLRLDRFMQSGNTDTKNDDYFSTRLSPNVGLVYQPILDELSVFANYQTGFVNQNPRITEVETQDTNGNTVKTFQQTPVKPQRAKQFEAGIKTNLFNNKLNLGASYYRIVVNDSYVLDPRRAVIPFGISVEEITSKGVEFELNANPYKNLSIRGSYSYNDNEITNAYNEYPYKTVIKEVLGRRSNAAGPKQTYNFWADYQFKEIELLKNIGIGAGFNGASKNVTVDNTVTGQFTLPAYTIYNAALYYNNKDFRIAVKANNISNEHYYTGWGTINPQNPRNFVGSITYKF